MESKFTDKEKLDLLLDYYKHLNNDYVHDNPLVLRFFKDKLYKKTRTIELQFASYLFKLYGYNDFPNVISDRDFDVLGYPIYYRGVEDINQHANMLCDYDYHCGVGADGSGLYFAKKHSIVDTYSKGKDENVLTTRFQGWYITKSEYDELLNYLRTSIMEMRLKIVFNKPNSLRPKDKEKLDEFVEYYKSLSSKDQEFLDVMILQEPFLTTYLGYDGLSKPWSGKDETEVLIVYNRSQILVNESEFKRITSASKNYKDGVIDFDKKKDEEFLME